MKSIDIMYLNLKKLDYHLGVKMLKFHINLESYKVTVFGGQTW